MWLEDDGLAGGREEEGVRNVPAAVAPKIMEFSLWVTKCSAYALLYVSSSFICLIFHVGAELRKGVTDNEKKFIALGAWWVFSACNILANHHARFQFQVWWKSQKIPCCQACVEDSAQLLGTLLWQAVTSEQQRHNSMSYHAFYHIHQRGVGVVRVEMWLLQQHVALLQCWPEHPQRE